MIRVYTLEDLKWHKIFIFYCVLLWNRDVNGAKNIYKIAYNHINGLDRPLYLCRCKQSDTLHDVSNHNL